MTQPDLVLPSRLRVADWKSIYWPRTAVFFAVTLFALLLFAAAFAVGYSKMHEGKILPGVRVAGYSLAGLDRRAAEAELRQRLPNLSTGQLTVRVGAVEQQVSYADIGRDYDMKRMLDQALGVGRAGSPLEQLGPQLDTLVDGVAVPAIVTFDTHELTARVAQIAAAAHVDAVNASITRPDGNFAVTPAVEGATVDDQAVVQQALAAVNNLSAADAAVSVETQPVAPTVTTQQAQAAVDRAQSVTASPLAVSAGGTTVSIPTATLNGWTYLTETGPGEWNLHIEHGPIVQFVDDLKFEIDVPATNASYTFEGRAPTVVQAVNGSEIDAAAAIDAVTNALQARADGSSVPSLALSMVPVVPEFSTAQAQELVGRVERLGRWTTTYQSSQLNGFGQNIRRPTQLINGTVVQPGEQFDFITATEPFTRRNGYEDGGAIRNNRTVSQGIIGGGLCSSSTTLFNAVMRAGFQIDKRHNHGFYIDRYPVGLDATIWEYGSTRKTMAFTNDSPYPILLRGINSRGRVTFEVWGVSDGRTVDVSRANVRNEREASTYVRYTNELEPGQFKRVEYATTGFDSTVTRVVRSATGAVLHEDTFNSDYARVNGIIDLGRSPGDPAAGTEVLLSQYRLNHPE